MCGIVGFLDRTETNGQAALGRTLLLMLEALACRGPDSTGVALFGTPPDDLTNQQAGDNRPAHTRANDRFVVRVKLGDRGDFQGRVHQITALAESLGVTGPFCTTGSYLRFQIDGGIDQERLVPGIEALDEEIEVVSVGRRLEIIKQVGSPANLEKTYCVSQFCGAHGLGHTRLSTESRVDLSHSQPFWGHGLPDLAIVHNGHITNYHQLRRRYEQRGFRLYTENDSEIIAVYLSDRLTQGRGLEESLRSLLRDLDGSYSCLVATASQLGFVKDPFALKPLVYTETPGFVAVATEEIAIRSALPGDYQVREAQVKEVHVWER